MNFISKNLKKGFNIVLFPEGTSSDGSRVLPFKSSLLGALDQREKKYKVQPVSIYYSKIDGIPIDRNFRPLFAWFGKMDLVSHVWQFLGLGLSEVRIEFHKPISFDCFRNRKEACSYCYNIISEKLSSNFNKFEVENQLKLYELKFL